MRLTVVNTTMLVLSWKPPILVWQYYSVIGYNITVWNVATSSLIENIHIAAMNRTIYQILLSGTDYISSGGCQTLIFSVAAITVINRRRLSSETQISGGFPQGELLSTAC